MTDKLRHFAAVALLLIGTLLLVACGGGDDNSTTSASPVTTGASPETTVWGLPGADLANSRFVGGPIDSSSVGQLGLAWTVPIKGSGSFGAYATTPVVSNGVIYTQDLASN